MRRTIWVGLFLLLVAGGAGAASVRAELELSSNWLAESDDLVATVRIVNDSPNVVSVPRWLVPGDRLDANLFDVTRDGEPVTYLGRLVKRAAPAAGDFVDLAPGEMLRGTTELTRHYDLVDGGEYVVAYRVDVLNGIGADALDAFAQKMQSGAVAVWRDAPVSGVRPFANLVPAAPASLTTTNCSSSQANQVTAAVSDALGYATNAKQYFDSRTPSTVGARYTTWFGASDAGRFNTAASHFSSIRTAFQSAPIVVDCGCTEAYYAYVFPAQPYTIYVCNAFWPAPATGTDSKAGTLVHEMSHFNVVAGTDDHVYGQNACRNLASSQPNLAVQNADSHEYFAENTPPLETGGGGAGSLRFAQGASSVDESAGSVTLTVRRTGGTAGAVSVDYATSNGTASSPADYSSRSGTLSWGNGDSADKSFTVPILDDSATEGDESFGASLSSPTGGATLGSPSATTVTIVDGDCTPSVCVADANTLCLAGGSGTPGRFRVRVTWRDFVGNSGPGVALSYTPDSGFFYFFNPQVLELLVKVVNGCGLNDAYWFFYGSTSNVALEYTVEDLLVCESKRVSVPLGQFASNGDTEFFDQSCP